MTDYKKLVEALRCCAENFGCPIECPRYSPADEGVRACVSRLEKDAAAAIEALQATIELMKPFMPDFFPDANKVTLPKMEVQDG